MNWNTQWKDVDVELNQCEKNLELLWFLKLFKLMNFEFAKKIYAALHILIIVQRRKIVTVNTQVFCYNFADKHHRSQSIPYLENSLEIKLMVKYRWYSNRKVKLTWTSWKWEIYSTLRWILESIEEKQEIVSFDLQSIDQQRHQRIRMLNLLEISS